MVSIAARLKKSTGQKKLAVLRKWSIRLEWTALSKNEGPAYIQKTVHFLISESILFPDRKTQVFFIKSSKICSDMELSLKGSPHSVWFNNAPDADRITFMDLNMRPTFEKNLVRLTHFQISNLSITLSKRQNRVRVNQFDDPNRTSNERNCNYFVNITLPLIPTI